MRKLGSIHPLHISPNKKHDNQLKTKKITEEQTNIKQNSKKIRKEKNEELTGKMKI